MALENGNISPLICSSTKDSFNPIYLKEYEAEHGPTPSDDPELLENGVGGKSGNTSGSGTPRGQNSGSVSPTHENNLSNLTGGITAASKSLDSSWTGNKMDTTAS